MCSMDILRESVRVGVTVCVAGWVWCIFLAVRSGSDRNVVSRWFKAILLEPSKFEWKRLRHECELDDGLGMDGKLIDNL